MAADGSIVIDTKIDTKDLKQQLEKVNKSLDDASKYYTSLGKEGAQSFKDIENQFKKIDAAAKISGDEIKALGDKKEVLQKKINALISSGLKPEDLQVKALKKTYDELTRAQTISSTAIEQKTKTLKQSIGNMKTAYLGLTAAVTVGVVVISKLIKGVSDLDKAYKVQASAERALSQAAANNPYLSGESVQNLKRFASELQKVSNYGDEVTIGLMTQLAAAGRTESEIQSIIKASADLAASGTTTFDGAVKNLNKTYSGLSGELGEVIPELKTLTAEQMKNGDAVDLIAKKYAGMALSVVDKSVQAKNAFGDLSEQMGRGLSPVVEGLSGLFGSLAAKMAEALSAANDLRDAEKAIDSGTATAQDKILVYEKELENMKTGLEFTKQSSYATKENIAMIEASIKAKEDSIARAKKQLEIEERLAHANSIGAKDAAEKASKELEATKKSNEKTDALIKAYSEWEAAQARANKAAEMGVTTQDEQMQELKRAAQEYQEKLVDITLQYGALGTASTDAFNAAKKVTSEEVIPKGSVIGGPVMPTGSSSSTIAMIMDLIAKANEGGDKAGKELTSSMASAIDDTSIGVSDAMGAVMGNIGAVFTTTVAVVKKIFAGIKAVAKFDPAEMYAGFEDILTGLTEFFAKVGSISSYIEAGKKVLFEFMRGMLENKEANMETFRNVLKYMIESAREVLPAVIEFAFIMMTDMATAIIEQLPLIIETAFDIVTSLATGILDSLPELIEAAGEILPALLYEIIMGIPSFYLEITGHLPEIITAIIEATIKMLPELTMAIIQAWIQTMYVMPVLIIAAILELLAEVVVTLVKDIYTLFTPAGKEIWAGIGKGIADGWNKFANDIKNAFNKIIDKFKEIFGIHSPSTVFAGFGGMIMEGLKNGITGAKIWDGIKSTFTTIIDNIKKLFSAETWTDIGNKIKDGITGAVTEADTKAKEAKEAATQALEAAKAKATELAAAAKAKADELAAAAKAKAEAAAAALKAKAEEAAAAAKAKAEEIAAEIKRKAEEAAAKAKAAAEAAAAAAKITLANIGSGITSGVKKVGDWFSGLFHAEGTNNFRGGTAIINEEGAEMVTLPSGSKVMTASATAQMQDRAISQLLSGMRMPSFATAGSGGNKSITIENKINSPIMVDGSVFGRLVYETIDKAVI